ncbi:ligase-associated DNA damage response exonuclease [Sphingopyxis alaskensis]|jgi:putative mRNA 3-end processing factor|uniref:Putative mRNA 3-end processing factor n=1 Tax=Sphingopyxis alaskensis (strain DSM 13593 / LMG 18877 / RB2256) TaxID=317655 RepID=Q1GWG0_SPHAL|nr:ligase-associated DNA damage response exonuclease [Sphingopyxis alaskensis]ABF52012.1 putative mRNA 3-end processing factor [Sphingopyxis alaskensis RB2256]MCM3419295.1 ligase-associated DNA damage response exonuclease [Sphingopyxis alaskensis]
MARATTWIEPHPGGIYVKPADLWIDPSRPVPRAAVTHGHADHARSGHGAVFATPETLAIMALRYGVDVAASHNRGFAYGEGFERGGVRFSFHPAGHVLGSAQILMEYRGERIVVTGDYKRRADPTCAAFEVVPCDIFITEATFGLPVFRHPPTQGEIAKLIDAVRAEPDRCVLVGAYALGKAQRLIAELRGAGWDAPIYIHGALEKMCTLYAVHGVDLGELRLVSETDRADMAGQIVVAPPAALNDRWSRRLPDPLTAMASGWMRVRQRARQRMVELPLVISDHADWDELTTTIAEVNPKETWITHGSEDGLLRWCELHQRQARALHLVGRDLEEEA